jgi:hypothetical protein
MIGKEPTTELLSPVQSLAATVDAYFATVSSIYEIATRRESDDPKKLVQLRRDLSQQLNDMNRLFGEATRYPDLDGRVAPLLAECSTMFSAERTAVANHQARWNAPAMQRDRAAYETQTTALFRLHEKNHRWRKTVLLPTLARHERFDRTYLLKGDF